MNSVTNAAPADDPDSVFRILISSDNHLGAWERDEVRKQDSFDAFDEVFKLATENKADIVLLGGDLFHDNRPSRATVVKAMSTLSKHCLVRPRGENAGGNGGRRSAAAMAAAAASGFEFDGDDGTYDGGNGDGNDGIDEEPKVRIVSRVGELLAG